jgi:hypothetical protein
LTTMNIMMRVRWDLNLATKRVQYLFDLAL